MNYIGYQYLIDERNADHVEKKNDYKKIYNSIGKVFPCKYCRDSYKKTTNTDRNNNLKAKCNSNDTKGCVIPKDGIYKKCIVTILNDEMSI